MGQPLSARPERGEDSAGRLTCDGRTLCYANGKDSWQIAVKDVRLIGEHATQSGPALDDYVIVIFRHDSDEWCEVPCTVLTSIPIWLLLRKAFPGLAPAGLVNPEQFNSRVLWPPEAAGHRLFECHRMRRGYRFVDRVLDAICPTFILTTTLVDEFKVRGPESASAHG